MQTLGQGLLAALLGYLTVVLLKYHDFSMSLATPDLGWPGPCQAHPWLRH